MRRNSASPTVSWYCRRTCARRGGAFDSAAASSILPSASRESMRSAVARALPGLPGAISWYRSSAPLASLSARSSAAAPNASSATSQRQRLSRRALGAATLKARNEVVVLLARRSQVAGLDVTEPANLLRYGGNLHGKRVVGRRELGKHALHVGLVLGNQRTLGASFAGVAKRIESRAAQSAQAPLSRERGIGLGSIRTGKGGALLQQSFIKKKRRRKGVMAVRIPFVSRQKTAAFSILARCPPAQKKALFFKTNRHAVELDGA